MRITTLLISLACASCAASAADETPAERSDASPPAVPDAGAIEASPLEPSIDTDSDTTSCTPGEVVGTVRITNTCYLDCYNACMHCDQPTGEASCVPFHHDGHAPYCPNMTFIACPEGSHGERTYMDQSTPYFPGTQHWALETYSCICDEKEGGAPS
jgi:hypothetical protein